MNALLPPTPPCLCTRLVCVCVHVCTWTNSEALTNVTESHPLHRIVLFFFFLQFTFIHSGEGHMRRTKVGGEVVPDYIFVYNKPEWVSLLLLKWSARDFVNTWGLLNCCEHLSTRWCRLLPPCIHLMSFTWKVFLGLPRFFFSAAVLLAFAQFPPFPRVV